MAERTVINRGPKGLNAAEQAYLAGEIDEPTFAKLYEGLQKPATDAATSLQQIGEQVEADAAAAINQNTLATQQLLSILAVWVPPGAVMNLGSPINLLIGD